MKSFTTVLFSILTFTAAAQYKYHEVGLGAATTHYYGDIGAVQWLPVEGAGLGQLTVRSQWGWHWSTRWNFSQGQLVGNDAWSASQAKLNRGISFKTGIREAALLTEFNFWPYATGSKFTKSFYVFAGLGLTEYTPEGFDPDREQWVDLRSLGTEGQNTELADLLPYGTLSSTTLMGMGYRHGLGRDFSATLELGWRRYGSDYIDDTSGKYVHPELLAQENGDLAAYFSNPGGVPFDNGLYRGNPNTKDWAIFAGVTIFYNIVPRNERCEGF